MSNEDTILVEDVVDELKSDPAIDSSGVAIAGHDGVITLSGVVPTYWQKIQAEHAVWRVRGVRGLADELHVEASGTHVRDDTDIATDAVAVLQSHSDLPSTIDATVRQGYITLTGIVDWHFQRLTAAKAVRHIRGVKGVYNNLELRGGPKVADVRTHIRNELLRTVNQEVNRIEIDTKDGSVTLRGTVQSQADAAAARRAAWAVPGVRNVHDLLAIS
ncbi:BON domain-containing protein [Mycolicibacterium brisbanense]|nr:BON domain-containing protein [Mycolicibacterium brisbanense]MCV7161537.1 BON domain-containing protein [Mycolicibacterium brisbanense]